LIPLFLLAPLPKQLPGGTCCSGCDKPQANWFLRPVDGLAPVCSTCVIYELPWDGKDPERLDAFMREVEVELGRKFDRDTAGRLLHCTDSDRIVAALVLASKVSTMAGGGR